MKRSIFSLLCVVLLASACNKKPWDEKNILAYYSNIFAYNMMDTYYLWRDEPEIAREIDNWNKIISITLIRMAIIRNKTKMENIPLKINMES